MRKHLHDGRTITLNPQTFLVIEIPDAHVLRILSRSLFVAMVLAALPFLGALIIGFYISSSFVPNVDIAASNSLDVGLLNSILHDFAQVGLLKENDKALIVNSPAPHVVFGETIDLVMDSDWESKSLFSDESYDFVFTSGGDIDAEFIDRILKIDGIVALPLGTKPSNSAFKEKTNYRIVHLKRYGFVIVALKKIGPAIRLADSDSSPKRKLLATKRVALKGLEDVVLEPPRKGFVKSSKYCPKKNIKFETHSLTIVSEDHFEVSDWLSKNVKEEEAEDNWVGGSTLPEGVAVYQSWA